MNKPAIPNEADANPDWLRFDPPRSVPLRLLEPAEISTVPHNQNDSILFTGLLVDLQDSTEALNSATAAAVELPAEVLSDDGLVGYCVDVRGTPRKSPDARPILTLTKSISASCQVSPDRSLQIADSPQTTQPMAWNKVRNKKRLHEARGAEERSRNRRERRFMSNSNMMRPASALCGLIFLACFVGCETQRQTKERDAVSRVMAASGSGRARSYVILDKPALTVNGEENTGVAHTAVKDTASTLFDHAAVDLQKDDQPLTSTWTAELVYPVVSDGNKPFATNYGADFRFFVFKDKDSAATIRGTFAGQPFSYTFPPGQIVSGQDLLRTKQGKVITKNGAELRLKIELSCTRPTESAAVVVNLDSIDIGFRSPPKR